MALWQTEKLYKTAHHSRCKQLLMKHRKSFREFVDEGLIAFLLTNYGSIYRDAVIPVLL